MARYANILNDDAFKVVIFTPGNEELMARMLEVLLPGKTIASLVFRPTEQHGLALSDKITNFDAVCTSDTGEMFIVEMQGLPQKSYADRMLCYASFPIRMQLEQKLKDIHDGKGKPMDYGLLPIYVVSFVNFIIAHEDLSILQEGLVSRYCICSPRTGEVMTESLQFVYLELGRLEAKLGEASKCKGLVEQLAYSLKYMRELEECPKAFEDKLFSLLFRASEYANLDVRKQLQVSEIMRTELDRIAENNYAREEGMKQGLEQGIERGRAEGIAEGLAEGKAEEKKTTAKNFRDLGVDISIISQATGLSPEEILAL